MHRRAHGGAWSAAVLLIGHCCEASGAEPTRGLGYSSGTKSPAVSSFSPLEGMSPVSSTGQAVVKTVEIVPTPFVPSASVLSQRGQFFSPTTVANVPIAQPMVTQNAIGAISSVGSSPADVAPARGSQILTGGPLVPVNLPAEDRARLEKALRGAAGHANSAPSETAKNSAAVQTKNGEPDAARSDVAATAAAQEPKKSGQVAEKKNAEPAEPARPASEASKKKPAVADEASRPAKSPTAPDAVTTVAQAEPPVSAAKITPLPSVDKEISTRATLPLNLPQTPIPLEYPKTDR